MGAVQLELVDGGRRAPGRPTASPGPTRVRVVDGALACIAGQGVAKTTLDDVARQAGCSRATVYRAFPGGKDAVLRAVVDTEVSRFFSALAVRMGEATDLEEVLVAGIVEAATRITTHPALDTLLRHEPELVLSQLAFGRMDDVLAVTCAFTTPFLGRWLDPAESRRVAEWAARIVVSYLLCPDESVVLTDAGHARRLVRTFVLPGIRVLSVHAGAPRPAGADSRGAPLASIDNHRIAFTTKGEAS